MLLHYLVYLPVSALAVFTTCALAFPMIKFEYHNYKELTKALETLHQMFPDMCDLYSIGQSVDGK